MQGRALTPDVILSGNLSVSKTVNLQNKVIYNNGQYEADEGYDGLGKVTVSVHNEMTDLKATENGVYLPPEGYDGFDRVDVDVPDPELDTIHITQNGRYTPPAGVDGYDDIHVNVNLNLESKTITSNGHYEPSQGKNGFSEVTVNVPERVPVIESKSITENGTYTAPAGVDGYSPITVNVPERVPVIESKSITENGTYTAPTGVDGYSPITVNVPLPANAYLLKELSNLPQPIASFNDGADAVMQSLKVDIKPVQSGSGDPSPTNIRPISGWTGCEVNVSGFNVWNFATDNIDKVLNNSGNLVDLTGWNTSDYISVKSNTPYYYKDIGSAQYVVSIAYYDADKRFIRSEGIGGSSYYASGTRTTPTNASYIRVVRRSDSNEACINISSSLNGHYYPYNVNSRDYTIPFTDSQGNPVEVYGGSVDVVNGGGNAYKEYPSYNGEILIGPWISDRDVYAPNTTPTIGAQVVDMGDTTTFYTQPTSIKSLDGENNVFASTGDVTECEYFTPGQ